MCCAGFTVQDRGICRCRWGSGVALAPAELRLLPAWPLQTVEEPEQQPGGHPGFGCRAVAGSRGPAGGPSPCRLLRRATGAREQLPLEVDGRCRGRELLQPIAWRVGTPAGPPQSEHRGCWRGVLHPSPVCAGLCV